jgi:hypothetical protein
MFAWWHRVRDEMLTRAPFRARMGSLRCELVRWFAVGHTCGVPKTAAVCREILKLREAL